MKKKSVMLLIAIFLLTGCNAGNNAHKNQANDIKYDNTQNQSQTETKGTLEVETSVDTSSYGKYLELFNNAKDDNDYMKDYEENGGISAGMAVKNIPENRTIVYNGEAISLDITGHASVETQLGLHIYINGIPQKYCTADNSEEKYVHTFPVKDGVEGSMTVKIKPSVGKAGEEVEMDLLYAYDPYYTPKGPHDRLQPALNTMNLDWCKIIMKADGTGFDSSGIQKVKNVKFTDYELSQYIFTRPDGTIANQLKKANFHVIQHSRYIIEDGKIRVLQQFGGGSGKEYMVTVYLNSRVLRTYKIELEGYKSRALIDEYVTLTEDMYKEYDIKDYNTCYFIAIPLDKMNDKRIRIQGGSSLVASSLDVLKR